MDPTFCWIEIRLENIYCLDKLTFKEEREN